MNPPKRSKINWVSLVVLAIGVLVTAGVIPEEYEEHLVELTLLVGPTLIIVFRTWFTEKKQQ